MSKKRTGVSLNVRLVRLLLHSGSVLLVSLFILNLNAVEYFYPVAQFNGTSILNIYQKTSNTIELWLWNYKINEWQQEIATRFMPANISVSPNQKAFGFIDNGILKIKYCNKRSPKLLDIGLPIYNIQWIHWLDNISCYFSALRGKYYGIYEYHLENEEKTIFQTNFDSMYPQIVDGNLFVIKRSVENFEHYYAIGQVAYANKAQKKKEKFENLIHYYQHSEHKKQQSLIKEHTFEEIIKFSQKPIAFLYMISQKEGFVVEYSSETAKDANFITFNYHHLIKNGKWLSTRLFSFNIPTQLLFSDLDSQLYESILPLLPRHYKNDIFFVSSSKGMGLNIFQYSIVSKLTIQLTYGFSKEEHFFAPVVLNNTLYYGGTIPTKDFSLNQLPLIS